MPRLFTVGVVAASAVVAKLVHNKKELERPRNDYGRPNFFIEGIKTVSQAPQKSAPEVSKDSQVTKSA